MAQEANKIVVALPLSSDIVDGFVEKI